MLAVIVAGLLAAAAPAAGAAPPADSALRAAPAGARPPDSTLPAPVAGPRVPGTRLRFGATPTQVERVIRTQPAAVAGGTMSRQGPVRFFGLDGRAVLVFRDGTLARVSVSVDNPSPKDIDYVEDELARQGFQRSCTQRQGIARNCEWTSWARVVLVTSETSLAADIEPAPRAAGGPTRASAAAPPETLRVALQPADSLPPPVVLDSCRAARPPLARDNGVFGRVMIDALVGLDGRVVATRVTRGVPMLDSAAVECARQYRFAPYLVGGRPSPFWVAIPVRFTL